MVEEKKEIWPTVAAVGAVIAVGAGVVYYFRERVPEITCDIDADCPAGHICRDGVCVPEKPPPGVAEFDSLEASYFKG